MLSIVFSDFLLHLHFGYHEPLSFITRFSKLKPFYLVRLSIRFSPGPLVNDIRAYTLHITFEWYRSAFKLCLCLYIQSYEVWIQGFWAQDSWYFIILSSSPLMRYKLSAKPTKKMFQKMIKDTSERQQEELEECHAREQVDTVDQFLLLFQQV